MSKHPYIDPCCKELRGIIMSHMPPACQDVVWLQPVKPGLFRWMVPTPYKNHTWVPVAVEQPIPKNALLEYFYDKVQENSMSPFKFYSESDTEALLGAYIYDEYGNVRMQGMLDFHCDGDQEGEDRIYFNQSVKDYDKGMGTYIKQFYDKIILSIEFSDGEHNLILSQDGLYYDSSQIITAELFKDNAVTSLKTEMGSFIYSDATYSLLTLSPTAATKGDVTITGNVDYKALLAFLNQAATEGDLLKYGDLLKHYEETFEENNSIPTVNNSVDVSVKYNGILGSLGLWAVNELDSESGTSPTDLTNYYKKSGAYSCLYTEDENSDDGCRTSVQMFPDYIKFTVDCSKETKNYYHNGVVMDKEKFHIEKNLQVDGNTYLSGDLYLGDLLIDPDSFKQTGVTSITTEVTKTGDYQIIILTANPATGAVTITGGIDKDALTALINQLIESGDIEIYTGTVETGKSYSGEVLVEHDVSMITGTITGNVEFAFVHTVFSALPRARHETHFILESKGSYTVTFPSDYQVTDGNTSQSLTDGQWIEINYISDGNKIYVRSDING